MSLTVLQPTLTSKNSTGRCVQTGPFPRVVGITAAGPNTTHSCTSQLRTNLSVDDLKQEVPDSGDIHTNPGGQRQETAARPSAFPLVTAPSTGPRTTHHCSHGDSSVSAASPSVGVTAGRKRKPGKPLGRLPPIS